MKVWLKKAKRWQWVWVWLSENRRFIHKQLLTRTSAFLKCHVKQRFSAGERLWLELSSLTAHWKSAQIQLHCKHAWRQVRTVHQHTATALGQSVTHRTVCDGDAPVSWLHDNLKTCTFSQTVHELIQLKSGGWPPARRQCSFQVQFSLSYKPGNWLTDYTFYHWWNNWCGNTSLCFYHKKPLDDKCFWFRNSFVVMVLSWS